MILYRCFAWHRGVRPDAPDGPLWFPRRFQGDGRHDNPAVYGCLYLSDRPQACIVEQLAAFRGQRLTAAFLRRRALPLALAQVEADESAVLLDLDDPSVLLREHLRPSRIATRDRAVTQAQALALHRAYPGVGGLQWWSVWEALWANVTLFDRAARGLRLVEVRELTLDDPDFRDAAEFFGLRIVRGS